MSKPSFIVSEIRQHFISIISISILDLFKFFSAFPKTLCILISARYNDHFIFVEVSGKFMGQEALYSKKKKNHFIARFIFEAVLAKP